MYEAYDGIIFEYGDIEYGQRIIKVEHIYSPLTWK